MSCWFIHELNDFIILIFDVKWHCWNCEGNGSMTMDVAVSFNFDIWIGVLWKEIVATQKVSNKKKTNPSYPISKGRYNSPTLFDFCQTKIGLNSIWRIWSDGKWIRLCFGLHYLVVSTYIVPCGISTYRSFDGDLKLFRTTRSVFGFLVIDSAL